MPFVCARCGKTFEDGGTYVDQRIGSVDSFFRRDPIYGKVLVCSSCANTGVYLVLGLASAVFLCFVGYGVYRIIPVVQKDPGPALIFGLLMAIIITMSYGLLLLFRKGFSLLGRFWGWFLNKFS